jgi:YrbI family 3-deoxy-D-manno-octulosonate 8-phosphate phosphatase
MSLRSPSDGHKNPSAPIKKLAKVRLLALDIDGVLTDGGMYYSVNGDEMKRFNAHDGQGIWMLQRAGIKIAFITREKSEIALRRAEKLKVREVHLGVLDKLSVLRQISAKNGIDMDHIAYIGDDFPDLEALEQVGFSACPADAVFEIRSSVDYVCALKGGEGCVREISDEILKAKKFDVRKAIASA